MFDLALSDVSTFISGASGGIGLTTVDTFLEQDALVTAHYGSNRAPLEKYESSSRVSIVGGDVRSENDVDRMFEESRKKLGKAVEVLVGESRYIFGSVGRQGRLLRKLRLASMGPRTVKDDGLIDDLDRADQASFLMTHLSEPRVHQPRQCSSERDVPRAMEQVCLSTFYSASCSLPFSASRSKRPSFDFPVRTIGINLT
jgi:NAD(P)-dependent dehydrogenase (short-subunit alcohol dehydrogenase family)